MDSYKRVRENKIVLNSTDLEGLKSELSEHLSRAMVRQPRNVTLQSYKIPMGFSGFVKAGEEISAILPFPIAGTLQDFMSVTPLGVKEVMAQITVVSATNSQRVETRLQDGYRGYNISANIAKLSYVKIKLVNKSKVDADCIVGFTFQEELTHEIKETRLIGNLEGGTLA